MKVCISSTVGLVYTLDYASIASFSQIYKTTQLLSQFKTHVEDEQFPLRCNPPSDSMKLSVIVQNWFKAYPARNQPRPP